jgi:hypothetical protein
MKYNIKEAIWTYVVWFLLSFFLGFFYASDLNVANWSTEVKNYVVLFGPVFGLFVFLAVLLWDEDSTKNPQT